MDREADPGTAGLRIWALGPPRVEAGGVPVEVDTRKATALLIYLVMTRTVQSRDALAGFLWPEHDQDHARAALRRTLSVLNKAIGDDKLRADRKVIELDETKIWFDVWRFRELVAEFSQQEQTDLLEEAVSLHRGDFLAGFALRDSPEFDDWQFFQAEALKAELSSALEALARVLASEGRSDDAIAYARRRVALDPLNEGAHRGLMMLLASAGNRTAALQQYRECVRILDRELGVAPLDETTELQRAISEGLLEPTPRSTVESAPPATPRATLPLVGRDEETGALRDAFRKASTSGELVIVEGEAGIGKSRLLNELLDDARAVGAPTVRSRAHEDESHLAYGCVADALRNLVRAAGNELAVAPRVRGHLRALLPEIDLPRETPGEGPADRNELFGSLWDFMLRQVEEDASPGVVVFDDLQWADEASLEFITYAAHRVPDSRICLALAWRSEEVPAGHRLRRLAARAQQDGYATTLTLQRLTKDDVVDLVSAVPNAAMPAEHLFQETEGVPFFVVEYLTAAAAGEYAVPQTVRDLLRSRIASLSETARQLVTAAAVIGRSFDVDIARRASGRTPDEVADAVEEATAKGIIHVVSEDAGLLYDFTHDQIRSAVYRDCSAPRRRLLHGRTADALLESRRGSIQSAVVAQHLRAAGRDEEAARHYEVAGRSAQTSFANAEAIDYFEAALELGHPDGAEIHEALADLRTLAGDYTGALADLEIAQAGSGIESPRIEHKIGLVQDRRGNFDLAARYLDHAAALAPADDLSLRARIEADRSTCAHRRGDDDKAVELGRAAIKLAEEADDPAALAQGHNILGMLLTDAGELERGRAHLEESLGLSEVIDDPTARVAALNNLALLHSRRGEPHAALDLTRTALDLCARQGDKHREAALHNNLADLLHETGQRDEAMIHLKKAAALFARIGEDAARQPEIWKLVTW